MRDPQYAEAYTLRVMLYNNLGQYPRAKEDPYKTILLNPDDPWAYAARAAKCAG